MELINENVDMSLKLVRMVYEWLSISSETAAIYKIINKIACSMQDHGSTQVVHLQEFP